MTYIGSKVISFDIIWPIVRTHTQQTDCNTWTSLWSVNITLSHGSYNAIRVKFASFWSDRYKLRFALCYGTVVLSVSLSVTLVYCGQTVRWIKVALGTAVRIGPGDIVLDGDPDPPQRKGAQQSPHFRPLSIVAKQSPISATAELLYSQSVHSIRLRCFVVYCCGSSNLVISAQRT